MHLSLPEGWYHFFTTLYVAIHHKNLSFLWQIMLHCLQIGREFNLNICQKKVTEQSELYTYLIKLGIYDQKLTCHG